MSWRYRQLRCTQCGREAIGRHLYGGPLCAKHLREAQEQEKRDKAAAWEQKLDPTLAEAISQIERQQKKGN
jgi:hypothetical protein